MKDAIAIVTESQEIIEKIGVCFPRSGILHFRSIDSIRRDDFFLLIIDFAIFKSSDTIQFLLSKIRKKIQQKPVLLIVNEDSLKNLNAEWFYNDFILNPFSSEELIFRSKRVCLDTGVDDDIIVIGRLRIDFKQYSVYLDNEKLDLTYKEFELLRLLIQNRGEVFSRKDLLGTIWGMQYIGGTRTVDVHIRRLRGKLGDEFNSIIETVRNVGYRCRLSR